MRQRELRYDPPSGIIKYKYIAARDGEDFAEEGLVGPVATAKSTAILDFAFRRGLDYPGSNILIARATLVSLKDSTLLRLEQRYGHIFRDGIGGAGMNRNEGVYRFPAAEHPITGEMVQSRIKAIGLDRDDIEQILKSTEFSTAVFEEADEIPSAAMDKVQERARQEIYHRSKTVKDLCVALSVRWGGHLDPEEVYDILRADRRHRVGQHSLELTDPMPGKTVVKMVWNPNGDNDVWARMVGLPYPDPAPLPDWVERNIGIREVHVESERLRRRKFFFLPGSIVKVPMPGGGFERRFAKSHREDGMIELISYPPGPGGQIPNKPKEVHEDDAGLIVQRNCIYVFPWENESRDYQNDENSYLMANQHLSDRAFLGSHDAREGRVFPVYKDEHVEQGGHVLPFPGIVALSKRGFPVVGGIDQGGNHATVVIAGIVTPETNTIILYDEYVRSGEAARETAYSAKEMILPGTPYYRFGYDPQMNARRFDTDVEYATINEYQEVLGEENLFPGIRGDSGFEMVNTQLMSTGNFIGRMAMPKLLVFDHLTYTRKALATVTKRMINHSRGDWRVDVADAIKILVSIVPNTFAEKSAFNPEDIFKARLAFSAKRGASQGMNGRSGGY